MNIARTTITNETYQLAENFDTIKNTRGKIESIFDLLQHHLSLLKKMYDDTIRANQNGVFMFGLDSFHFQGKLLDVECDDLRRQFLLINNRMYCEYYKLYKLIVEYIQKQIPDSLRSSSSSGGADASSGKRLHDMIKSTPKLPVYKDLEPYRVYPFPVVEEAHANILMALHGLHDHIQTRDKILTGHLRNQNLGLNINNFVSTMEYDINLIRVKVRLFESYLTFFHELHSKYLKHFSDKMNLLYTRMLSDVHFEEPANSTIATTNAATHMTMETTCISSSTTNSLSLASPLPARERRPLEKSSTPRGEAVHDMNATPRSRSSSSLVPCESIPSPGPMTGDKRNMKQVFQKNVGKLMQGLRFLGNKSSAAPCATHTNTPQSTTANEEDVVSFSIVEESPVVAEESPVVAEETPLVVDESPLVVEETPLVVIEESPLVVDESPVVAEEIPLVVIEESPLVVEESPVVVDESPLVVEESPVVVDESLVVAEEIPLVVIEETPVVIEETPVVIEETPLVVEKTPSVVEKPIEVAVQELCVIIDEIMTTGSLSASLIEEERQPMSQTTSPLRSEDLSSPRSGAERQSVTFFSSSPSRKQQEEDATSEKTESEIAFGIAVEVLVELADKATCTTEDNMSFGEADSELEEVESQPPFAAVAEGEVEVTYAEVYETGETNDE